jgi:hypothetical protein
MRRPRCKIENGFHPVSGENRLKKSSSSKEILSLDRHQPLARTSQCQLNSKRGGKQDVNFTSLDFLKIARGNFSALGQRILRHALANPLPAHIRTEDVDSLPFFLGNRHDILHRFLVLEMNDTYIVKSFGFFLPALACTCKPHQGWNLFGAIFLETQLFLTI